MAETMAEVTDIDVLRARLAEGLAFVPSRRVRVLLAEHDAAVEAVSAYASDNDTLTARARIAEDHRLEAERAAVATAERLRQIAADILAAASPAAQDRETP